MPQHGHGFVSATNQIIISDTSNLYFLMGDACPVLVPTRTDGLKN